jgi:hypothetical protein
MNNPFSHARLSVIAILVGMLCLEGCSLYHNFIWYQPKLLNENDEVVTSEKGDYEIWDYYTKTTANAWLIFFFPFLPLGEDFEGPHPYHHKGDFVIWVKKQEECPVVYVNDNPVYGEIFEDEPYDITGMNESHDLCHYGKLPIEQQQIYTIKYKGEERRYLFIRNQWQGYTPLWFPSA